MTSKPAAHNASSNDGEEFRPEVGERKLNLLVIEDDEKILEAITEYFSRAGYTVQTAEDGLSGVQAALNDRPDAIVLDLMLPKMDGLDVCRELREKAPYITILGARGGSGMAASAVNTLLRLAAGGESP